MPKRSLRAADPVRTALLLACAALLGGCPAGGQGGGAPSPPAAAAGAPETAAEGLRLARQGDLAGAEPRLVAALRDRPGDPRLLEALGFVYARTDRWRQAEILYRQAMSAAPGSPGARLGLARVLSDTGRDREALELLRAPGAAPGPGPASGLETARILQRLGRPREAADAARAVVGLEPRNAEAHYLLGLALEDEGDRAGAYAALQQAAAIDPGHLGALAHLATLATRLGHAAEAERAREAHRAALARRRVDDRVRGHRVAGVEAFNRQDYATALREFELIAREDPRDPQAHLYAGSSLLALGRRAEARAALDRSLALDPRNERALLEIGRLEALEERLDASVAALRQAIALNPEFAEPHYFLSGVLMAQGEAEAARAEMQRYEALRRLAPQGALQIAEPQPGAPR